MCIGCGENLERRFLLLTLGSWEKDASEIDARRLNAKEVLTTRKGEMFIFCFADGTAKLCGKDHEVRESTLRQDQPVMSPDLRKELQENS